TAMARVRNGTRMSTETCRRMGTPLARNRVNAPRRNTKGHLPYPTKVPLGVHRCRWGAGARSRRGPPLPVVEGFPGRRELARPEGEAYLQRMPHARIDGVWLHYRVEGEGEPLLLLMGFGAPLQGWDPQIPAFAGRYRVIRLDNRGVGRSDRPLGAYTVTRLAEDARGLLDHLGIERAHVVGKSMGGMAAMELAARHPHRVRSLVLAATTPASDARLRWTMTNITARVGAAMLRAGGNLKERVHAGREEFIRIWLPYLFSKEAGAKEEALLRRLIDAAFVEGFSLSGLAGQLGACFSHDARSRLSRIQAPTLVLGGT